jgi:deoxyinosine 3'endonuclease (endonuclease V)
MRLSIKHRWDVKPGEAREIQEDLRKKWEGSDRLGAIRTVAGLDAALVLSRRLRKSLEFPYVPGFLSFWRYRFC